MKASSAKCTFCNKEIDPTTMDWGVAYDMYSDDSYAYHQECFEMSGALDEES